MTAILIAAAGVVLIRSFRTRPLAGLVLVALLADLAYVVSVGGDFMCGRFLTPATAVSAMALVHFGAPLFQARSRLQGVALGLAGVSMSLSFSPFREERDLEKREFPYSRIVNERAWYRDHLLLHMNLRPASWKEDGLYTDGLEVRRRKQRVTVAGNVGLYAWGAGPDVHVVDHLALTDPLLARVPFAYDANWRTGHLSRTVPDGYVKSLEEGRNLIEDACLAKYYDRLNLLIRGPLFTKERWRAIVELNLPGAVTVKPCPEQPRTRRPGLRLR